MKKRITSLFLIMLMIFNIIPTNVFAHEISSTGFESTVTAEIPETTGDFNEEEVESSLGQTIKTIEEGAGVEKVAEEKTLNGFVSDIFIPKARNYLVEGIPGYTFNPEITEYDIVLADIATIKNLQIKVHDNFAGEVYASFYIDGVLTAPGLNVNGPKQTLINNTGKEFASAIILGTTAKYFPVGETRTLTIRVGKLDSEKNFTVYDDYTFHISRKLTLREFAVSSDGDAVSFSPQYQAYNTEITTYSAVCNADKINLTATSYTATAKVYVGEEEFVSGSEIDLKEYTQPGSEIANIPISVRYEEDGKESLRSDYNLYITKQDYRPIIKIQPQNMTVDKGNTIPLTVEVEETTTGTLSYQWYDCSGVKAEKIPGATSASYLPPTSYAGIYKYKCEITNKVDEFSAMVQSDEVEFVVNLNELTAPEFTGPLATFGNGGTTKYYQNAAPIIDVTLLTKNNDYVEGVPYTVLLYRNSINSTEGGELIECEQLSRQPNLFTFALPSQDISGTWYYYAVVTVSKEGFQDASRASAPLALTFTETSEIVKKLNGSGSKEDPFLIRNVKDLEYVKELVEGTNGTIYNFDGQTLAFTQDIYLPDDWEPIGILKDGTKDEEDGKNILAFSGTIDGRGNTLVVADCGKPLFNYVRRASIKNLELKGEHIKGYGLVDRYCVDYGENGVYEYNELKLRTIDIEHITIKAGTKILKSGFIGGYSSGVNAVNIKNCIAEKGVIIGDDGTWGNLENTDYGYPYIEDGLFDHKDCIGTFAGAYNGVMDNCISYATVYGDQYVGGLVGMKGQSMGDCDISNSAFLGEIIATGNRVGGVIGAGYIASSAADAPNAYVRNCYVAAKINGADEVGGIVGGSHTVVDNAFFYGEIRGTGSYVDGVIGCRNWSEETNSEEVSYYYLDSCGVGSKDDPASATAEEFADGTILNKLSAFYSNWKQDEKYPVLNEKPVIANISVQGTYKTEYYLGEEFELDGMKVYAHWTDGEVTDIDMNDIEISGYDNTKAGLQKITVKYGSIVTTLEITVLKNTMGNITVYLSVLGDDAHGETSGEIHTLTNNNLTEWISEKDYEVDINATVWDVLQMAFVQNEISWTAGSSLGTVYIESLNYKGVTLGEFTNGRKSGWMYTINDIHSNLGVDQQYLEDGDVIVFHYTDDYTAEKNDMTVIIPSDVIRLINAIGDVSLDSKAAINAAREAYTTLSKEQRAEVTNYDVLLAAEKTLKELKNTSVVDVYKETGEYLENLANETTPTVNSIGGEWLVLGLVRSGKEVPAGYYENVVNYVKENINENNQLHRSKSTDNSRLILALTAAGYDVTNVGGYNLLEGLTDMNYVEKQGINGPIWALIAFDSHDYEIPAGGDVTREKLIETILAAQTSDGGWNLNEEAETADPDMTGMAIQALAPYYESNEKVKAALDKALTVLSKLQEDTGAFVSSDDVLTSESTAQVLVALTALGIDPAKDERFIKEGNTIIDGLIPFAFENGGFRHVLSGGLDGMATEQGYYALAAYYRFLDGETTLYDMSDVTIDMVPGEEAGGSKDEEETGKPGESEDTAEKEEQSDNPDTGDRTLIMLYTLAAMASLLAVYGTFVFRKKGQKNS